EAALREALRLKPDFPGAHNNLAAALMDQGRSKEAEAACRTAIRLKPDFPEAHYNLGYALGAQGRPKEAEAACRAAIGLKPDYPEAHGLRGLALREQGKFEASHQELRRGHQLCNPTSPWRPTLALWARQAERLLELNRQLPAVLRGDAEP